MSKSQNTIIRLKDVDKYYESGGTPFPVLQKINLTIKSGDYWAIMGTSGSGKSTLMNILGCLDRPTTGYYEFEGTDINKMDDDDLSHIRNQRIGFVFQNFNLLPRMTAQDNVELPLIYSGISHSSRRKQAEAILRKVGLSDRCHHTPSKLSGGQKQRVAIARALINNPAIVLADEPTGNLDTKTGESIMELFNELNYEGRTIVLVTHERDIADQASKSIYIRDGRIIESRRTSK